jgi:tetratricopeptide (TPR) repeat protein/tRNA A-37 threonylcarbamoyl transferase component Bud32
MERDRWERLERLFHEALALPPDEREAFLRREAPDPALRQELMALLDADAADGTIRPPEPASTASAGRSLEGRSIGPYTVLHRIGEGGMGAVYLAEREDVDKRVALKLVRGALVAPELTRRFLLERRVLARLEHPYIARLMDAGMTDDETPWFALEYVDGEPITDYCRERDLSVNHRLRLFRDVCEAVSYAHVNLVVHRDIKPSNVMVTADGTVKLLDFGIAKLLGDEDADSTLTRTGVRVMSPAYAAPEQLVGEPVTTATDVYSLGVLLYELLTGERPRAVSVDGSPTGERRAEPVRPSLTAARSGERGAAQLAGDLDAICLRAIAPEPDRRYRSAEQFRDDITRYLDGLPVEARLPTFRYRAGKFVRRHAAALAGAVVLALSLGGGLGAAVWQGQRAERARDDAQTALDRSRSVSTFLIDLFQQADPTRTGGEQVTAVDLVERGIARIDELDHDPVLQALLLENLAHVDMGLGRYDEATRLAARAVELRRPLDPDSAFVTALNALGMTYNQRGLPDSARGVYAEALPLSRQIMGVEHDETLALMNNLAIVYGRLDRNEEAKSLLREMIEIERRVLPNESVRSIALSNLGVQLAAEGDFGEAQRLLREALDVRVAADGEETIGASFAMDNLGMALREAGRYDEAEPFLRRGMEIRREILGEEHRYFAESLFSLGTLLALRAGPVDLPEADSLLNGALGIYVAVLGPENRATAYILHSLGLLAEQRGDLAEAERRFRQALEIRRTADRDNASVTVKSYTALARVLRRRGATEEAVAVAEEGDALAAAELRPEHPEWAESRAELGLALGAAGRAGAADAFRAGTTGLAGLLGSDHPRVGRVCDAAPGAGLSAPEACLD